MTRAHVERDGGTTFFAAAARWFLLEDLARGGVRTESRLAALAGEPGAGERPHGILVRVADDVRHHGVVGNDLRRENDERDHQVCDEESARGRDEVGKGAPRARAPLHPEARRRRAAKAPSAPCRCGSTRSRPASTAAAGTTPSGGGSSVHSPP